MDKDDIKRRIEQEADYIRCPKFGNSLNKYIAANPDGLEDTTIARLLMMTEEEVEKIYSEAVDKLREQIADKEA